MIRIIMLILSLICLAFCIAMFIVVLFAGKYDKELEDKELENFINQYEEVNGKVCNKKNK